MEGIPIQKLDEAYQKAATEEKFRYVINMRSLRRARPTKAKVSSRADSTRFAVLALAPVVGRRKAALFAKELRKVAWV